ncbi:zinc-dependent alcohol dehydrogenase [Jiangella alkaliphila]|uniref:L-iditol 2-dehydrogenase n=1 Tax=Jiangella alkaliphila TaxID=419479 RepID=A0A1H2LE32_9ACTN|nr:zinc-binding dehydrogenase [Jiangella alkaliphila]SDU79277.1 L-iditol 2-dehydrogenase [Jiangella alkaliphila]
MKAAFLYGAGDLRVQQVADPVPGPGEATIEIHASGVCPSDIRGYTGAKSYASPWTPGHEIAGTVTQLGPQVEGTWRVGDRVVVDWRGVCGTCRQCRRGAANFCESVVKHPIAGFAEFTKMPVGQLRLIPDPVSFEAASFCEPLACVLNAHRSVPMPLAADVLVIGAGPIGLLHTQVAARRGARVIVTDRIASRLEVARSVGAHDVVLAGDDGGAGEVRALTDGYGPDAVVVTVGHPAAIRSALAMAAKNATVNLFAGTHPKGTVELDPDIPHYEQVSINGSHDFSPHDFSTALRLLQFGMVQTDPLVSHRFGLDGIAEAFETTRSQAGLKSLITA